MSANRTAMRYGLVLLALAIGLVVSHRAVTADEERLLEVNVVVCPAGADRSSRVACEERVARDFAVSAVDAAFAPVAAEATPGADGPAAVALDAETAGEVRVVVNTAAEVGSREVACEADGRTVDARLTGGAAAIPVFDVAVPAAGNVSCVVYLYGFPNDDTALDIAPASATPVAATPLAAGTPILATPMSE